MKKLSILLLLGVFAGCGGGSAADEAMSKMKAARDKACACKDLACAEKSKEDFKDWTKKNIDRLKKGGKPSKSFQEKFGKLGDEADACIAKLKPADPPPPPPVVEPTPTAPVPAAPAAAPPAATP